jgi:uncharacterized protein (TIGR02117 family)
LRWILRSLTALISLPLLYYCAALLGALAPGVSADLPRAADQFIGLVRGPIHYDLLLPMTPEIRSHFGYAEAAGVDIANPNAEWLVVGWGAREFYTSTATLSQINNKAVWRGIFGDDSVIHLDISGNLRGVDTIDFRGLSSQQMAALLDFIDSSLKRDQTGLPIALTERFSDHDAFFAGRGQFNLFRTCNVWVGEALRAAGLPFGLWTPTPQAVDLSLHWFAQR